MIGGVSHVADQPSVFPWEETGGDSDLPQETPPLQQETVKPDFDLAIFCQVNFMATYNPADLRQVQAAERYVNEKHESFKKVAEEVNDLLAAKHMPSLDPEKAVPAYALSRVRAALGREMGDVLRFLLARNLNTVYKNLILVGLFGKIPEKEIKLGRQIPKRETHEDIKELGFLRNSVLLHLDTPFLELTKTQQADRIRYYEYFYSLLDAREQKIIYIRRKAPQVFADFKWQRHKIEVTKSAFETIMKFARSEFADLCELAIDNEMQVRVTYLVLLSFFGDNAKLFHFPDDSSPFILKDSILAITGSIESPPNSYIEFLLDVESIPYHLSKFTNEVLFPNRRSHLIIKGTAHPVGGPECDFPIEEIKEYFLSEIGKNASWIHKVKSNGAFAKILGEKGKLTKDDLINLFKGVYKKYNEAKTISQGYFIIHQLNRICDSVACTQEEVRAVPEIETLFPLFLLQVIFQMAYNFSDHLIGIYKEKGMKDAHLDMVFHVLEDFDKMLILIKTSFIEELGAAYTVSGSVAVDSVWGIARVRVVPIERMAFSPFISSDAFSMLTSGVKK